MDTPTGKAQSQGTTTSGIARISGRLEHARSMSTQAGRVILSLIKMPAADEYASPATVEVVSKHSLGAKGDTLTVLVRIGGAQRSFDMTEPETGQKVKVQTATNRLEVVEV